MTILLAKTAQLRWQTDLSLLLHPIQQQVTALNWLVADLEYHFIDDQQPRTIVEWDTEGWYAIVTGQGLYESVANRDIQVIWGVFCGMVGDIPNLTEDEAPYVDGSEKLWAKPEAFQLASSEIEIVCCDSSLTLVKFRDESLGRLFLEAFPDGRIVQSADDMLKSYQERP